MVNVGGTSWTIVFGEGGNCAVVQQFDPFGGLVYTIALVNGEQGEAVVLFIARQHMLSGFFLEFSQLFMELHDGGHVLILLLVVNSVLVSNSLYK